MVLTQPTMFPYGLNSKNALLPHIVSWLCLYCVPLNVPEVPAVVAVALTGL